MYKKRIMTLLLLAFLISLLTLTIRANSNNNDNKDDYEIDQNFSYVENQFLNSSRFTTKTSVSTEKLNNYYNNYQINYKEEDLNFLGYELVLENDEYLLYFENDSYSIVLINKQTGFMWSSRNEFQVQGDSTAINIRGQMNSGIWIDYINTNNYNYLTTKTSIYNEAGVTYYNNAEDEIFDGFEHLYRYKIRDNSYKKTSMRVDSVIDSKSKVITSKVDFITLGISFEVNLSLKSDGINVYIDRDKIENKIERNQLTNIYIFPNLGSVREDKVPGYFMIPDGLGALVRFGKVTARDFLAKFYGGDNGYGDDYIANLTLPIFGIVHNENENAMYAIINEGAETSLLEGVFWGSTSNYFRLSSKYQVRQVYWDVIDRAGNGNKKLLVDFTPSNFDIDFNFLTSDDASYVGIAKDYQEKLVLEEVLTKKEISTNKIPLQTEYLLSDRENSFIGTKKITMSTTDQIKEMYQFFYNQGIDNQVLNLLGYTTSGNYGKTPYKLKFVEKEKNFKSLNALVNDDNNLIFIENNYVLSSSLSSRVNYNKDVARSLSKTRMTYNRRDINGNSYQAYLLYPNRSSRYLSKDLSKIENLNFSGLTLSSEGNTLFTSYLSGNYQFRKDSILVYEEMLSTLSNVQLRMPNLYAYKYMDSYLDLPVTNTQYDYYSDLVPLIPLVLKGYVSYFSPNLNYNALGKERLLSMVDFGVNPSFILTFEPTFKMRYTMSFLEYSTTFSNYENEVIETYNYLNNALKNVIGETIVNREVLESGVVRVTYSNNVKIYVNYTSKKYTSGSVTVNPSDYKVVLS